MGAIVTNGAAELTSCAQEAAPRGESRLPGRQLWFVASTLAVAMVAGTAIATPFAETMIVVIPGFPGMFQTAMFVINLLLTALLFIKGTIETRGDSIRLGTAFLFTTLIIIPQTASFPGGLMPDRLIGTEQTASWMWCFWRVGFGCWIIRYAWFARRHTTGGSSVLRALAVASALVAVITWISASCTRLLPALMVEGHFALSGAALVVWITVAVVAVAALASVVTLPEMTPRRLWLVLAMIASCVEVWLTVRGSARYTLGWYVARAGSLFASLAVLIALLRDITLLYSQAAASNVMLRQLARLDPLTELFNRRGFDELLEEEFRRAQRQELPLAVVMIDVDLFKAYNDHYGHPAGDDCLRSVSAAVKGALWRPGDSAARYGGEELVIMLPATDLKGAAIIAERMRGAVAALAIPHRGSPLDTVTISAGVGALLPIRAGDTAADLVAAADRALYRAKKDGRNRVRGEMAYAPVALERAGSRSRSEILPRSSASSY